MLIEVHVIQNHSPANLNRDDLGAPKTCYFGGVMRSRISSQCIKRSIRTSEDFKALCGGVRTRQLARLIAERAGGTEAARKRAEKILALCGLKPKESKKAEADEDAVASDKSKMLVYTTYEAIDEMARLLQGDQKASDKELAELFGKLVAERVAVPDMALGGRMLEPDKSAKAIWKGLDTTVEAALQVAHAISTHAARPEVDYYVAADDVPGEDAGAGYVDEAMFASACFYKYFSIHWEALVENLNGNEDMAAHTVGAFIRGVARVNPTGKQNSFAAHNPPDGMLVEVKDAPISYANAFADPVSVDGGRGLVSESIARLAQYVHDLDMGYGQPQQRFWFSPNLRYPLEVVEDDEAVSLAENNVESLDQLVAAVVAAVGFDWAEVQSAIVC